MSKSNNYQVIRPIGKPLSEAEKKERILRFLSQKREQFSIGILCSLCENYPESLRNEDELIDRAVSLADKLMEKLYPIKEEEKPKEEKEK